MREKKTSKAVQGYRLNTQKKDCGNCQRNLCNELNSHVPVENKSIDRSEIIVVDGPFQLKWEVTMVGLSNHIKA